MSVTADLMGTSRGTGPITIHDYGDRALLLEFGSTAEVLAWTDAVRRAALLGVVDIVPASRTVLIKLADPRYQAPTRQRLGKLRVTAEALSEVTAPANGRADIEIDVVYDGADLDEVARLTGMTTDQVSESRCETSESDLPQGAGVRGHHLIGRHSGEPGHLVEVGAVIHHIDLDVGAPIMG